MMRALAARPMSLTELDSGITELSYPALERRLSSMRIAGLVEAQRERGGHALRGHRVGPARGRADRRRQTANWFTCGAAPRR